MAAQDTAPDTATARKQEGRLRVMKAAADAFLERGFAATSIDDISDRLEATKGLVYHYFRTKGAILLSIHERAMELALETVEPIIDGPGGPSERLYRMAREHVLLMSTETSFMRLSVHHAEMKLALDGRTRESEVRRIAKMRNEYQATYAKVIEKGIADGEFREGDPDIHAKAVLGALNWVSVWYRSDRDRDDRRRHQVAHQIALTAVNGLRGTWTPDEND